MLTMFYVPVVAGVIVYAEVCWGNSMKVSPTKGVDKIISRGLALSWGSSKTF